ncbi:hypothetical protein STW0522ENT66_36760 [Enterobacter roggenkampii]|nr:hypothetical protein STW0522ENT66_36760 [Enterobacter roggenkampii]
MAIYPSYFKLQVRWLHSLTPVTYLCTLPGIRSLAALLGLWPRPFGASASAVQNGKPFCPATRII